MENVKGMRARKGIFRAAKLLVSDPEIGGISVSQVNELLDWFSENLEPPDRFTSSSSKGYYRRHTKGLSWFKPSATKHISKAFELRSILEECGYPIVILKERRLGRIVYEDAYQLVAEPFSDTIT